MEENITNVKERILQVLEYKEFAKENFFEKIGVSYGNFKGKSKFSAPSTDLIDKISSNIPDINLDWLIKGEGNMLKNDNTPVAVPANNNSEGIPLIPLDAMAGVASGEISVMELDCERYIIPVFSGADYLITVKGSSMYPKYSSGDIVACKKLSLTDIFFQWNKVYVLDTRQGALIKRIKKTSSKETILLVSENPNYDSFELKINQINAISLVIGVIRLE